MPKTESEHDIQVRLMQYCHRHEDPRLSLVFAIPNGGSRHRAEAVRLKAEGVKKGIPDLFFPIIDAPKRRYGLFLELKRPKGRVSPEQSAMRDTLRKAGYSSEIAYGYDQAVNIIEQYLAD